MKIMENAIMVHIKLERDGGIEDVREFDIAVEACFDYYEDEAWQKDLHESVEARYNKYHYWDNIEITQEIFVKGERHIVTL